MRAGGLLVVLAFIGACASAQTDAYEVWASEPTPDYWSADSTWAFTAIGTDGQIERSMILRFATANAETCVSGDWKEIEVLHQSPQRSPLFIGEAAYMITGRALLVNLTANICDNYTEYRGQLTANGFVGRQHVGHMFGGEEVGPVYGVPWSVVSE